MARTFFSRISSEKKPNNSDIGIAQRSISSTIRSFFMDVFFPFSSISKSGIAKSNDKSSLLSLLKSNVVEAFKPAFTVANAIFATLLVKIGCIFSNSFCLSCCIDESP